MNKKILSFGSAAALTFASIMPIYAQVTVPKTFTAGEAAVAADVNENFNALATAANNNATALEANTAAIATLPSGGCPTNAGEMVQVGKLCVDKYEASVFDNAEGTGSQYGLFANGDDHICDDNGNNCSGSDELSNIYAHSIAGVGPSTSITWFQATQACANVGKRLLTNAEWQMAAAGTPDPGADDDDTTSCATKTPTTGMVVSTGSRTACISNWGVNDMVGNVNEWVADWIQGNSDDTPPLNNGTAGADFGADAMVNVNAPTTASAPAANFPAAIYRGGRAGASGNAGTGPGVFAFYANSSPAGFDDQLGFRCAQ